MFGMLHGGLPRITQDGINLDALEAAVAAGTASAAALRQATERRVAEVVAAQVDAGLELVTDGQVRWPDLEAAAAVAFGDTMPRVGEAPGPGFLVAAWGATALLTDRPVAQAVPGPYTLGTRAVRGPASRRRKRTLAYARALAAELHALAEAGCPVVVVEEPAAIGIGSSSAERRLFVDAHRRLLAGLPDLHAMLAISGGSAVAAAAETIFAAPYRSHLFDLIAGPDDWLLVREAPPDRGIVCAVLRAGPEAAAFPGDPAPVLVWAANYAASTGLRGLARVGLANATPLRNLDPADALSAIGDLGRAATLAAMSPEDAIAAGLDPRTFGNNITPKRRRKPPPKG